ncbi:LysR substrate-binding domain-containing protein [Methylobacterium sp. ID0610]|uniref:LysR substrate-binding domain-containing protein n=1 Tax=Methylobacterium carpenticola TaxID=3344827 RepID=UPI00368A9A57
MSQVPRRSLVGRVDLFTLKLFVAVVDEHSIAAAAARENIATSAASKRLSDLEHAVGLQLVVRHHKGIEATPAGRAVRQHALTILRNLSLLEDEMQEYGSGLRGHVRVFANESTIIGYLPEELRQFLEAYPHVEVELEAKVSTSIVQAVRDGEADLGLFSGDIVTEGLAVHPYHGDCLVVLAPAGHALAHCQSVSALELLDSQLIEQERGSSIDLILTRMAAEHGRSARGRIRVSSFHAMGRMVEAGLGLGVVPERVARHIAVLTDVRILSLDAPWARRQHRICARDDGSLSKAAQLLRRHLAGTGR